VPASLFYIVFHSFKRNDPAFFATDLLNDLLAHGESSRLKENLEKKKKIFSEINAYLSGSIDTGMFVISGTVSQGISPETAEKAVWQELEDLAGERVGDSELQKVKNKVEASHQFSESNLLARTMNLAYYELLGDADLMNRQIDGYFRVAAEDIRLLASEMFSKKRATVLYYLTKKQS